MRAIYFLIVLLFPMFLAADVTVIMSYLNNSSISGSQLCAAIVRGENVGSKVCKTLPAAGGLTSIQNTINKNEFHVFYNMRPNTGGPIRIFRDTLTRNPFQFAPGSTRAFFNTNSFFNFSIDNQLSTSQRVANRVDIRALNNSNNFIGPFRPLPAFFGSPYCTSILNDQNGPFTSTLFRGTGSNPDGLTFRNLRTNTTRSFAFTGTERPLNIAKIKCPSARADLLALIREDHLGQPRKVSTSLRWFNSNDNFTPVGNQIRVDPPRPDPNPNSFNTSCITQVRIVTPSGANEFHGNAFFNRYRSEGNSYDWFSRSYRCGDSPGLVGGARRVVTNPSNTNSYGCSATAFDPDDSD
jgi:hypothetical protein